MEYWNLAILVGALLLLVSIVASDISSRMGAPLLLVFLALGMLAGEDGPGGIKFDDFDVTYLVGALALAVIIFDGGMRTQRETFRVALLPALTLAAPGVVITAALVGLFSATQRYRNCMRVSVGYLWTERTEQALREVGKLARQQIGEPAVSA